MRGQERAKLETLACVAQFDLHPGLSSHAEG
jgi:hypothetical protein